MDETALGMSVPIPISTMHRTCSRTGSSSTPYKPPYQCPLSDPSASKSASIFTRSIWSFQCPDLQSSKLTYLTRPRFPNRVTDGDGSEKHERRMAPEPVTEWRTASRRYLRLIVHSVPPRCLIEYCLTPA